MPSYVKFLKKILSKKHKLTKDEPIVLTEECSEIIQRKLSPKLKDPGSFSIPCKIGTLIVDKVSCDLGASNNVLPLFMMTELGILEVKPTRTILQMADRFTKQAYGIIEDILVKVDKLIIHVDFIILDTEEDVILSMIFGRPFLATSGALIDVPKAQPKDKIYYTDEKKDEEEHKEKSPQPYEECKPKVKMESPRARENTEKLSLEFLRKLNLINMQRSIWKGTILDRGDMVITELRF
ncbi:uncharacterized protein LOC133304025 [Gastrolobium bilobum]|uniref:uncharacterized protein LOC133304025 n=1 Tax=Gastrolobium bilobum TaxID=150636 RepID=UPI002AB23D90|nr:uncharacterized protein LOC133304025 [Gastrolobium bilobum]